MTPDIVMSHIKSAYLKYYDTAFWFNNDIIMRERAKLLNLDKNAAQEVFLETVLPYASKVSMADACKEAGVDDSLAAHLLCLEKM